MDVTDRDVDGKTALHWAVECGEGIGGRSVQLLVKRQRDLVEAKARPACACTLTFVYRVLTVEVKYMYVLNLNHLEIPRQRHYANIHVHVASGKTKLTLIHVLTLFVVPWSSY